MPFKKLKKGISNIGTKILFQTGFSHNSTQKAPPELIPELIGPKFYVDSIFDVKTGFKAFCDIFFKNLHEALASHVLKKLIFLTKYEID